MVQHEYHRTLPSRNFTGTNGYNDRRHSVGDVTKLRRIILKYAEPKSVLIKQLSHYL